MSFKSRGETIKEWWDVLDNTELLTWDVFEKKGKAIISTLPETGQTFHLLCSPCRTRNVCRDGRQDGQICARIQSSSQKDEKKQLWKEWQTECCGRYLFSYVARFNLLQDSGKVDLNRTYVPSSEIVKALNPYLEKVWELYLAFVWKTGGTNLIHLRKNPLRKLSDLGLTTFQYVSFSLLQACSDRLTVF